MAVQRGEVYFVDLDPTVGHEQGGRRPVVVVSSNLLNNHPLVAVAVPGTKKSRAPSPQVWNVLVPAGEGGLVYDTVFMTFQVRALDQQRFWQAPQGILNPATMNRIERALLHTLAIPRRPPPP